MPYPRENIFRKTATAAANTAVTVDIGQPGANMRWRLIGVRWSYNAAPTAGKVTIEDGIEAEPFAVDITGAGPGEQELGWQSAPSVDVKATLAAAGAVVGRLTLIYTID